MKRKKHELYETTHCYTRNVHRGLPVNKINGNVYISITELNP